MTDTHIKERIEIVRRQIERASERAGRDSASITLIAVTKTVGTDRIEAAYDAGVRDFGENYVQEAVEKWEPLLRRLPECRLHFIGHLQSNKAKDVVGRFDLIQSVSSAGLASTLSHRAVLAGVTVAVLVEVKLDAESDNKFGVDASEAPELCAGVAHLPGLRLCGLMGMAPTAPDPELTRPAFILLKKLFDALPEDARKVLSMGMSGDYEVAIEEGATHVRIGRAIFGARG